MRIRLIHWALAALLVISQTALLQHLSDIDGHSKSGSCTQCLLGHGLNNAVPSQPSFSSPLSNSAALVCSLPGSDYRHLAVKPYLTRAPPFYARHS